jgi:TRAP-type C4-dicarboxylate transport system permease small subunit
MISADVICRKFFDNPIMGVTQIVQNMTVVIVFLMLPWATKLEQHVRSNMILARLSARANRVFDFISYLIGVGLFVGVIASCWEPMIRSFEIGDYDGDIVPFPLGPVWLAIIVTSALCLLQSCLKLVAALKGTAKIQSVEQNAGIEEVND